MKYTKNFNWQQMRIKDFVLANFKDANKEIRIHFKDGDVMQYKPLEKNPASITFGIKDWEDEIEIALKITARDIEKIEWRLLPQKVLDFLSFLVLSEWLDFDGEWYRIKSFNLPDDYDPLCDIQNLEMIEMISFYGSKTIKKVDLTWFKDRYHNTVPVDPEEFLKKFEIQPFNLLPTNEDLPNRSDIIESEKLKKLFKATENSDATNG